MGYIASTRSSILEAMRVGMKTPRVEGLTRDIPGRSRGTASDLMALKNWVTFYTCLV